jgi:arylsulfatase A-like enzyme
MSAFVIGAALVGLIACTSGVTEKQASPTPPKLPRRPNIIFVLTDDLATTLVPYMPHVQSLERAGTSFRNYYVVDSLCCPSRSAIFTGQFPHDDGVFTNVAPDGGYNAYNQHDDPPKSFAVALQKAGYRTGFMGKYLNGYQPKDQQPPGWNEWDVAGNGYGEFNYQLNVNGKLRFYGKQPGDYLTDVLSTKATSFIKSSRASGKPFALEVATFAPHRPWVPAPRDLNTFVGLKAPRGPTFDRTPTDAPPWLAAQKPLPKKKIAIIDRGFEREVEAVQAVDQMIGRLQQTLKQEGLLDDTYIVFSSDNGFHLGQYRLLPGKMTAFDTDIKVPLVVSGPGVPANRSVSALTSSIDLAPTFLQIGNTGPTDRPDGVSLLGLLHGQPPPADWQQAVLIEHHGGSGPGDPDAQAIASGDPPSYEAMRTATALYVEYVTGAREYYDLSTDPNELHNVVSMLPPARLAALHSTLHALESCHGAAACQAAARVRARR